MLDETDPDETPLVPGAPRFCLGRIFVTDAALSALGAAGLPPRLLLWRHVRGDWGDVAPETQAYNERALALGYRLMSCYRLRAGDPWGTRMEHMEHTDAAWVFTEASRRVTLLVVQSEYGL